MKTNIEILIEETLNSLEGIEKASVPDFFATRTLAKLQKRQDNNAQFGWTPVQKPVWAIAVLLLFLVVNMFMLNHPIVDTNKNISSTKEASIQEFASEYNLTSNSLY